MYELKAVTAQARVAAALPSRHKHWRPRRCPSASAPGNLDVHLILLGARQLNRFENISNTPRKQEPIATFCARIHRPVQAAAASWKHPGANPVDLDASLWLDLQRCRRPPPHLGGKHERP